MSRSLAIAATRLFGVIMGLLGYESIYAHLSVYTRLSSRGFSDDRRYPASSEECNCSRRRPRGSQARAGCLTILHKESATLIDPGYAAMR